MAPLPASMTDARPSPRVLPPYIRRAEPRDGDAMYRLELDSIHSAWRGHYDDAQIRAWCQSLHPTYRRDAQSVRELLVAEQDGRVVAFGQLHPRKARIEALYAAPSHMRRGLGQSLLNCMERTGWDLGLEALDVTASLCAVSFYRAAGYVEQGPRDFELPGARLPALLMKKPRPPSATP